MSRSKIAKLTRKRREKQIQGRIKALSRRPHSSIQVTFKGRGNDAHRGTSIARRGDTTFRECGHCEGKPGQKGLEPADKPLLQEIGKGRGVQGLTTKESSAARKTSIRLEEGRREDFGEKKSRRSICISISGKKRHQKYGEWQGEEK